MHRNTKAFTLVELSVVIVIVGLIISGITAGRSLVASAGLNSQITDLQKYNTAFNTFVMQYKEIPGDLSKATSYWGVGVTNGDGNGKLNCVSDVDMGSPTAEIFTLFQHLAAAKLIPGTYNNTYALGTGYPKLKIDSRKGMIACSAFGSTGATWQITTGYVYKAALFLQVSKPSVATGGYDDSEGTLSPTQAYNIDVKIDDGLARQGLFKSFQAFSSTNGTCLTANDSNSYTITNSKASCHAEYVLKK